MAVRPEHSGKRKGFAGLRAMIKPEILLPAPSSAREDLDRQELSPAHLLETIAQFHWQDLLNRLQKRFPLPERPGRNPRSSP